MQNQMIWPEAHSSFASCGRPKTSSIYRDPPRTRQRTLILAAFLPWGGSDDTVTRRTGPQHTRFRPARAAATRRSASPQDCTPPTCRGAGAQHQDRAWLRCWWAVAMPGRASNDALSHTQQHGAAGVEGAGGTGGHGRASRSTTPSRRLACGDLAGGRARRRPEHQRRLEHQRRHRQQKPRNLKRSRGPVAEDGGFEPPRACTQHAFQACAIGH